MIEYSDWKISTHGFRTHDAQFTESIFCQSNGYFGARAAFLIDGALPYERCTYMAGGFDFISPGLTDIVNLPDPFHFSLVIAGSRPGQDSGYYSGFSQSLDLSNGVYTRESVWVDEQGNETEIRLSRLISMSDKHTAALCIELTARNHNSDAEILTGLDAGVLNLPVNDDQMLRNDKTVRMLRVTEQGSINNCCRLKVESPTSRLAVDIRCKIDHATGTQDDGSVEGLPARRLLIPLKQQRKTRVEKIISLNDDCGPPAYDYKAILDSSATSWALRWKDADVIVETDDPKVQAALRWNLFQLMQSRPFSNPDVSIGARGLTHARYKGCYFWDTEIFLQPFFLYTEPAAARDLVRFRLSTLQDAHENAAKLNLKGARFPWMCAIGGKEQCHTWDIGRCEIHITADVAYAAEQYIRLTKDESLKTKVTELYIETARYWASRFTYDERGDAYNLLFVKGPDEYCGVSSNNAYTVFLARHNLMLALVATENGYGAGVSQQETDFWRDIVKKAHINYDATLDLYIQDDTFMRLEPLNLSSRENDAPLYRTFDYDRLQRYRVLKQADMVLLMLLLPDEFTDRQKRAIWDFYEPITLHDSSLSYGIHAWAAAVLGERTKAEHYLMKSLYLDLENILDNTGSEGVHMAALGATWQALVFGFAGLTVGHDGQPALNPRLPEKWRSMKFSFYAGGERYAADITKEGYSIKKDSGAIQ